MNLPIFVHHCNDDKESFFDYHTAGKNTGNEYWNVLIVKMEESWTVFANIGPSDSISISCSKSSDISKPTTTDTKNILNHYFPVKSHLQVFDVIEFSEHDPQGMIAAFLFTYCRIYRQP